MTSFDLHKLQHTRRSFLGHSARSIGSVALASLLSPQLLRGAVSATGNREPGTGNSPHWQGVLNPLNFAPRAKRIIHLYMAGGPSHLETLDYKPKLVDLS